RIDPHRRPPARTSSPASRRSWDRPSRVRLPTPPRGRPTGSAIQPLLRPAGRFIDATFVGGLEIGATKRGKGMKIMAIVDRHGLPLSVSTHAANHHEVRLVQLCFDFYMIEAKPENLIGDGAYDSDPLDAELRKDGIEMIAPHRSNRSKPSTQDRRRLSR